MQEQFAVKESPRSQGDLGMSWQKTESHRYGVKRG